MGLPGARLPSNFSLPRGSVFHIFAKGGPSYASTAVVVQKCLLDCFGLIDDAGSDRRMWIKVSSGGIVILLWLVYYFPPFPSDASPDDAWHQEASGLRADMLKLRDLFPGVPVLWSGDTNAQPTMMQGGPDRHLSRDEVFSGLLSDFALSLLNPIVTPSMATSIWLPLRKRAVTLCAGHTHHGPGIASRAIDMTAISCGTPAEFMIHNMLHCKEAGCQWDICAEYTLGDHFLLSMFLPDICLAPPPSAEPSPPRGWDNLDMWSHGLEAANATLQAFGKVLIPLCNHLEAAKGARKPSHGASMWLADAAACLLAVVEGLARDGWVLATRLTGRRPPAPAPSPLSAPIFLYEANDPDYLADDLKRALSTGSLPSAPITAAMNWLRPPSLRPPAHLGSLSRADSHALRCTTIRQQSISPAGWDIAFHDLVCNFARSVTGKSRLARGEGELDFPITQVDWAAAATAWDASNAASPDLLPRCAFSLTASEWAVVAWLCQRPCAS